MSVVKFLVELRLPHYMGQVSFMGIMILSDSCDMVYP